MREREPEWCASNSSLRASAGSVPPCPECVCERERDCACVCVRERERETEGERERECVCVCDREKECVYICVCGGQREREWCASNSSLRASAGSVPPWCDGVRVQEPRLCAAQHPDHDSCFIVRPREGEWEGERERVRE